MAIDMSKLSPAEQALVRKELNLTDAPTSTREKPEKRMRADFRHESSTMLADSGTKELKRCAPFVGRTVTITFDSLPDRRLHPNHRKSNFWAQRSKASKEARQEAWYRGDGYILGNLNHVPISRCEIEEVFTIPTKRRMDIEGLIASSKSWIDGIVEAGVIQDDGWQNVVRLSGRIVYEKGKEQTQIIINEVR